jgi:hypothetical protein
MKDNYQELIVKNIFSYEDPKLHDEKAVKDFREKIKSIEIPKRRLMGLLPMNSKTEDRIVAQKESQIRSEWSASSKIDFSQLFKDEMKKYHGFERMSVGCSIRSINDALLNY